MVRTSDGSSIGASAARSAANEKKDDEERKNDARGKVWKARATDARGAAGGTHIDGKR
jgi:hypothetical protein